MAVEVLGPGASYLIAVSSSSAGAEQFFKMASGRATLWVVPHRIAECSGRGPVAD